ncbi:hypothetical protein RRG08_054892 [Elysia crispata]|uniref:Uncharacterized protein n=1 Tax=Elysia crispata TaxID=231223 RepID=A0AAE1A594_9GAST|nr:hypothetical protein RRG08_054892 [Elysia crispata]
MTQTQAITTETVKPATLVSTRQVRWPLDHQSAPTQAMNSQTSRPAGREIRMKRNWVSCLACKAADFWHRSPVYSDRCLARVWPEGIWAFSHRRLVSGQPASAGNSTGPQCNLAATYCALPGSCARALQIYGLAVRMRS